MAAADSFVRFKEFIEGGIRDPYPYFAEMRRRGPVHAVGDEHPLRDWFPQAPGLPKFEVYTYDVANEVLRDPATFSSVPPRPELAPESHLGTIVTMDDPEHQRYRSLLSGTFSRRVLLQWERTRIRPVIRACVEPFAGRGHAELMREFCWVFPARVIGRLLGLADERLGDFHQWAVEYMSIAFDLDVAMEASRALDREMLALFHERRRHPTDDIIGLLASADPGGEPLSELFVCDFLKLLLAAGVETTYRSTGNLLFALLSDPDRLEAVAADRSVIPAAVEEALRWEPPITATTYRFATRDTELAGVRIPAGAYVIVNHGATGRDEGRYERPDEFDLSRPTRPHLAFGFGAHTCLGIHLARIEIAAAVGVLLDRLPNLRLDPDVADVHIAGGFLRGPSGLPVLFG
jgi:cytochrome P450